MKRCNWCQATENQEEMKAILTPDQLIEFCKECGGSERVMNLDTGETENVANLYNRLINSNE